jgi:hypothetical protein
MRLRLRFVYAYVLCAFPGATSEIVHSVSYKLFVWFPSQVGKTTTVLSLQTKQKVMQQYRRARVVEELDRTTHVTRTEWSDRALHWAVRDLPVTTRA